MSQCVAIATQLDYGFVVQGINPLATFEASLRDAAHCNIMLPVDCHLPMKDGQEH